MGADLGCAVTLGKISRADKQLTLSGNTALHEELEIKCFYEGSATLLVESKSVSVKAGDVVVINPYEFHVTIDVGQEQGKYHLFILSLDYFSQLAQIDLRELLLGEEKKFRNLFSEDPQIYDFLCAAAEETKQRQAHEEMAVKGLLMCVLSQLLRRGMVDAETPVPEKTSLRLYPVIDPALKCIKSQYAEHLTVDRLAELCNVSKHYFCRVFKTVIKKSPMEYLREFRLRIADAMLSATDRSVAEISAYCGFENPNYFSRCYKQHFGESPLRNSRRKKNQSQPKQ